MVLNKNRERYRNAICLMYDKLTIDAVFIMRMLQEGYCDKTECMCFVDVEKAFYKVLSI